MYNKAKVKNANIQRKKRIKHIKIAIITIVIICLVLPTILSIVMFVKMNSLQKQLNILKESRLNINIDDVKANYDAVSGAMVSKSNDIMDLTMAQQFFEKNLYHKSEEYAASLEQNEKNEYNNMEADATSNKEDNSGQTIENERIIVKGREELNSELPEGTKEQLQVEDKVITDSEPDIDNSDKQTNNQLKAKQLKMDDFTDLSDRQVYLTFDDGPSDYTDDILDLLAKYNVKATFFVIGKTDEHSKKMYQRIVNEGHTLGMHSYSHDYSVIYNSLEDFDKDFTKLRNLLYDTTGYLPDIYRFPGGSSNEVSKEDMSVFINYLNEKSVVYFDWNVVNGDATGEKLTPNESYENVISGVKLHKRSIVLMHDTDAKISTLESLEDMIRTLVNDKAVILKLDHSVTPIQQVKDSSIEP